MKNGNVYYLGFYCKGDGDIYCDIVRRYCHVPRSLGENVEEIRFENYKIYLNHGDTAVPLSGYDLLQEKQCSQLGPYDVVLVEA